MAGNCRKKSAAMLLALLFLAGLSVAPMLASGEKDGMGSILSDGKSCGECHFEGGVDVFKVSHTSIAVGASMPRLIIRASVDFTSVPVNPSIIGLMVLAEESGLPEDDGWVILSDPLHNTEPKNYCEMIYEGKKDYSWELINNAGNYSVIVRLYYGNGAEGIYIEKELSVTLKLAIDNTPPQLESPSAQQLAPQSYLFGVVYKDADGDYPVEIWVNISSYGSYKMERTRISEPDWRGGEDYGVAQDLSPGKHSYHISAYDGSNWNETEKIVFYVQSASSDTSDSAGMIIALAIGIIGSGAIIYYSRK